jgi:hypothetical protein
MWRTEAGKFHLYLSGLRWRAHARAPPPSPHQLPGGWPPTDALDLGPRCIDFDLSPASSDESVSQPRRASFNSRMPSYPGRTRKERSCRCSARRLRPLSKVRFMVPFRLAGIWQGLLSCKTSLRPLLPPSRHGWCSGKGVVAQGKARRLHGAAGGFQWREDDECHGGRQFAQNSTVGKCFKCLPVLSVSPTVEIHLLLNICKSNQHL